MTARAKGLKHLGVRKMKREFLGRSAYAVAMELKRSDGLPVGELAERLGMSYMGVKAQCIALEKSGHLTSRSMHRGAGRPHMIYRLSERGHELFQIGDQQFALSLLKGAKALFGPASAEKLIYLHFQSQAGAYAARIPHSGTLDEKLAALAEIRKSEGTMPRIHEGSLIESHCPLTEIFSDYPRAEAMEEATISMALGVQVKRRRDGDQIRFETLKVTAQDAS